MPLHILGLNHTTAPVEIREKVVFSGDGMNQALQRILALDCVHEAVILSTCNRSEIYVASEDARGLEQVDLDRLVERVALRVLGLVVVAGLLDELDGRMVGPGGVRVRG